MKVTFTHRNLEITPAMKEYTLTKFSKVEKRVPENTRVDVLFTDQKENKGESTDMRIEVLVHLPDNFIKVQKEGADYYALVDAVEKVLKLQLDKVKKNIPHKI